MIFQILFLFILCTFYIIYFTKMLMLKKQGINANILGKGDKPKKALIIERTLRIITLAGAAVQFISVIFPKLVWSFEHLLSLQISGTILGAIDVVFFVLSVTVMRNNWRAGFDKKQNTELVTSGVYKISRNPAFVGFDLLISAARCHARISSILLLLSSRSPRSIFKYWARKNFVPMCSDEPILTIRQKSGDICDILSIFRNL